MVNLSFCSVYENLLSRDACIPIIKHVQYKWNYQEQDKSSDIEQQPPFGDHKISNIQPKNRGRGFKTNRNII